MNQDDIFCGSVQNLSYYYFNLLTHAVALNGNPLLRDGTWYVKNLFNYGVLKIRQLL